MKRLSAIVLLSGIFFIAFSLLPATVFGQPDPGGDPDAPIDGGVVLLIAAGVGYGVKRTREQRKKNKSVQLTNQINQ